MTRAPNREQIKVEALCRAVNNGTVDSLIRILGMGADPNGKDLSGRTALMYASTKRNTQFMTILLSRNANPNLKDGNGDTALMYATKSYHYEAVRILLEGGASPNIENDVKFTPLIHAAATRNREISELLLRNNAILPSDSPLMSPRHGPLRFLMPLSAKTGNIAVGKALLDIGVNPDESDRYGITALMYVARGENSDQNAQAAKYLVDKHASLVLKDRSGRNALMHAAQAGNVAVLKYFASIGANFNQRDEEGKSILQYASDQDNMEAVEVVVQAILEGGADLNSVNPGGQTDLIVLVLEDKTKAAQYLIERGASLDPVDLQGDTALIAAAYNLNIGLIKNLVKNGADVDAKNDRNMTALAILASNEEIEINMLLDVMSFLIENGAKIYDKDLILCDFYRLPIIKFLVENGEVNVNVQQDGDGCTVLMMLAESPPQAEGIEFLASNGADLDLKDSEGRTALMHAANGGNFVNLQALIIAGADIDIIDKNGDNALIHAAKGMKVQSTETTNRTRTIEIILQNSDSKDVLSYLLERLERLGIEKDAATEYIMRVAAKIADITLLQGLLYRAKLDPNAQDKEGKTALMFMASSTNSRALTLLTEAGANPELADQLKRTPLMYAASHKNMEALRNLTRMGADFYALDAYGITVLGHAGLRENDQALRFLLEEANMDIDFRNEANGTALMLLAHHGKIDAVQYLIDLDADIDAKDNYGMTALMYAASNGKVEVVEYLIEQGADFKAKNKDGKTALDIATKAGEIKVSTLLSETSKKSRTRKRPNRFGLRVDEVKRFRSELRELENQTRA